MIDHEWEHYVEPRPKLIPWSKRWRGALQALRGEEYPLLAATSDDLEAALGLVRRSDVEITSLRASLDGAYREISRLTGEKHARDVALRRGSEDPTDRIIREIFR